MAINFTLLKQWWNKDLTFKMLMPSAVLLLLTILFQISVFGYLSFILLFTVFDIFGFHMIIEIGKYKNNEFDTIAYRIIQVTFQIIFTLLLYYLCGWQCALASTIAWWFTVCDKLFYIFRQEKDYDGDYFWLSSWSIFAIFKMFGKKEVRTKEFNIVSAIGFIIGLVICVL